MALNSDNPRMLRFAALAGMIGPILFAGMLTTLTILQYDFMRSLRWEPLDPVDWPSGLSLGPHGGWMIGTFILSGLFLMLFALSLRQLFPKSLGPALLFISGIAMVLLSSLTDPTYSSAPKTWHGLLHDNAYILLGLSFLPGSILLALEFRRHAEWRFYAPLTWLVLVLIVPSFILKGVAFYIFLLAILTWYELVAVRIWQLIHKTDQ